MVGAALLRLRRRTLRRGPDGRGAEWFGRAAAADPGEDTDAAERYEIMDSVVIEDLSGPDDEPDSAEADQDAPAAGQGEQDEPAADED